MLLEGKLISTWPRFTASTLASFFPQILIRPSGWHRVLAVYDLKNCRFMLSQNHYVFIQHFLLAYFKVHTRTWKILYFILYVGTSKVHVVRFLSANWEWGWMKKRVCFDLVSIIFSFSLEIFRISIGGCIKNLKIVTSLCMTAKVEWVNCLAKIILCIVCFI